jgi:hypothetical protein
MSGWEQVGEFFNVLAQELEIWNWMGDEAWEHNPLLISETYGQDSWMNDAAWGAAYTSGAAAISALGLIGLEYFGISSIGSTPLWGGGTAATTSTTGGQASCNLGQSFLNMMEAEMQELAAQQASTQVYNQAAWSFFQGAADGLEAYATRIGLNILDPTIGTWLAETAMMITLDAFPLWK